MFVVNGRNKTESSDEQMSAQCCCLGQFHWDKHRKEVCNDYCVIYWQSVYAQELFLEDAADKLLLQNCVNCIIDHNKQVKQGMNDCNFVMERSSTSSTCNVHSANHRQAQRFTPLTFSLRFFIILFLVAMMVLEIGHCQGVNVLGLFFSEIGLKCRRNQETLQKSLIFFRERKFNS